MRFLLLGILIALLPASVGYDASAAQPRLPAEAQRAPTTIAIGDSITQGGGTSRPYYNSYPAQAGVASLGIGGTCVLENSCSRTGGPWVMDWLPEALRATSPRPTRAIVLLGINDVRVAPPGEIVRGLKQVRRYLRSQGVRTVFGTLTPPPRNLSFMNASRLPVNRWIRSQRNYVDYARALQTRKRFLPLRYQSAAHDIHPGDQGARRMASKLTRWLASH